MNKDSVVGGSYLRERGPAQAEFSSVVNPDRKTWGKSRDLRKVPGYKRQSRNRAFIRYSSKLGVVGLNHQWPGDNLRTLNLRCETHSCFYFKPFCDIVFVNERFQRLAYCLTLPQILCTLRHITTEASSPTLF